MMFPLLWTFVFSLSLCFEMVFVDFFVFFWLAKWNAWGVDVLLCCFLKEVLKQLCSWFIVSLWLFWSYFWWCKYCLTINLQSICISSIYWIYWVCFNLQSTLAASVGGSRGSLSAIKSCTNNGGGRLLVVWNCWCWLNNCLWVKKTGTVPQKKTVWLKKKNGLAKEKIDKFTCGPQGLTSFWPIANCWRVMPWFCWKVLGKTLEGLTVRHADGDFEKKNVFSFEFLEKV